MLATLLPAILAALLGVALVAIVLHDAFLTILVPRRVGRSSRLTTQFYIHTWRVWRSIARGVTNVSARETVLGYYAPLSLIVLLGVWATALISGYALLQYAAGRLAGEPGRTVATWVYLSGETFFTLGYGDITPGSMAGRWLSVLEAGMGFGFFGTVIGYLPTLYSGFSQREQEISLLDQRAGSPPTAVKLLKRSGGDGGTDTLTARLADWERWSAQVLETHVSYPLLAYYRSQHVNQSWLGAMACVLDATALRMAGAGEGVIAKERALQTFAMARHALVDITQIFVPRMPAGLPERLPSADLARLREVLAGTVWAPPEHAAFEAKLTGIRRTYEPYLQALAAHLLIELPGWLPEHDRRDNWQGGPWDRQLGVRNATEFRSDEHF